MILLKILLILLLVVLGLLALLLFFPISYAAAGKSDGTLTLHADVRWLFFLIFFRASFDAVEKKPLVVLRILGIPITLYPRKPKKKRQKGKHRESAPEEIKAPDVEETTREEGMLHEQRESLFERICRFFRRIPKKLRQVGERIRFFYDKAGLIRTELLDPHNRDAVSHIGAEGKMLFRHYRPRRLRTDLTFSAGDPATTGELTGVVSLLPMVYARGNKLRPDFTAEEAYLQGTFSVSGHIVLIFAVVAVVRLIADRNFRRLLKHIRAMR